MLTCMSAGTPAWFSRNKSSAARYSFLIQNNIIRFSPFALSAFWNDFADRLTVIQRLGESSMAGLLRWNKESIKLSLTEGLRGRAVTASEDWMLSRFCDPLLLLCSSCMCLSGTLLSQLFPQVAHRRGNTTSLIHRNELCALWLALFLYHSCSPHHRPAHPSFTSTSSMSLMGRCRQIIDCGRFCFILQSWQLSRRQIVSISG